MELNFADSTVTDGISQAKRAQKLLKLVQGTRSISYAGAYTRYGFHEDGFTTGIEAAEAAIASSGSPLTLPFELVRDIDESLSYTPDLWSRVAPVFFDFLEVSNLRVVLGILFGSMLTSLRLILGYFFDLSL